MKLWKQFFTAITAGLFCVSNLPAVRTILPEMAITASAKEETIDNLTYQLLEDGTIEITNYSGSATEVTIPEKIDGKAVTSIGSYAFNSANLTAVTIPHGIISIERQAFSYCTNLTSVVIPDSVTRIASEAFLCCSNLTSVSIPSSVTTVESGVFADTPWLEAKQKENPLVIANGILLDGSTCVGDVTIPNHVTYITDEAFYRCPNLTSIIIPDSVTQIGGSAFYGCSSLTSVTISDSVTTIGDFAFSVTPWLTEKRKQNPQVIINGILIDGFSCTGIVSVPNNTSCIGESAFGGNADLTEIILPNSVTRIKSHAFQTCLNLSAVTIPNSVTDIEKSAFEYCTSLVNVTIPDSMTTIERQLFSYCENLTTVTIPKSITSIEKYAFSNCPNLTDVYYGGTKEMWDNITVAAGNTAFRSATIHFADDTVQESYLLGDIDKDTLVTPDDAYLCLRAYARMSVGIDSGLSTVQEYAADVDRDSKVTVNDAYFILVYYARQSVGKHANWDDMIGIS